MQIPAQSTVRSYAKWWLFSAAILLGLACTGGCAIGKGDQHRGHDRDDHHGNRHHDNRHHDKHDRH